MSCSYTKSRERFISKGILNDYNNLTQDTGANITKFNEEVAYLKNLATKKFGYLPEGIKYPVKLFGKKAVFNNSFFEWVDRQNDTMLQLDSNYVTGPDGALDKKLKTLMTAAGINYQAVKDITDRNGNKIDAIAVSDFALKTIKVIEGKARLDTLPEEVAHFYVAALPKDSIIYRVMYDKVTSYPEYKRVVMEYGELYNNDEKLLREEAMGKLIANGIVNNFADSKHKSWFDKVWEWIKSKLGIFQSERLENDLFFESGKNILEGGLKKTDLVGESMYQLGTPNKTIASQIVSKSNKFEKRLVSNQDIKGIAKKYLDQSGKTERYVDKETGKLITKRVTDAQTKMFVDKMGLQKSEKINSTPDNVIKRDTGTLVHATVDAIANIAIKETTNKYVEKEFTKEVEDVEKLRNAAGLSIAQYAELTKGVKGIISQIADMQKEIDPNGKVTILTEVTLVDEKRDVGGSTDMIAIFSDGTASIYDYKTITPNAVYLQKDKLIADPIPFYKKTSYNSQMVQYKEILSDVYGVKGFRHTRVVPIRMDFKYKPKGQGQEGAYLTKDIKNITFADNESAYLKQLPLAKELTGDKNLDEFISKMENVLHNLERKIESDAVTGKEKIATIDKINKYKESLNNLRIKKQYGTVVRDASNLIREVETRLAIADVNNDLYATTGDLLSYVYDLTAFTALNHSFSNITMPADDVAKVHAISGRIAMIINEVEDALMQRLEEMAKNKGEDLNTLSTIDINMFTRFSEASHPVFRTFYKLVNERQEAIRKKINGFAKELEELTKEIKSFDPLINDKTGNLHSRLTEEFLKERSRAWREVDIPALKSMYNFKADKDPSTYADRLTKFIENQKALGLKDDALEAKIKTWKLYNDYTQDFYWSKGNAKYDVELKPEMYQKYKSDAFKQIESDPALLKFYNLIESKNMEFRRLLDLDYKDLPDTFLPNIKREFMDKIMEGQFGFGDHTANMLDNLKINEDRERFSKMVNPITGELELTVPIFYINPIKPEEKSREIAQSMLLFAKMAYNYQEMNSIEADVEGLRYLLENNKIQILERDNKGERFKNFAGEWSTKLGVDNKALDYYKQWQRYYIYGIKIDNSAIEVDAIGDYSKTKLLLAAKSYVAGNVLALNLIGAAGAYGASRINLFYEGVKGIWYDTNSSNAATKSMATDWKKYHALGELVEPFAEDLTRLKAHNLKLSNVSKYVSPETLMSPYRKVDERIDLQILNSMSHYWGVDEDGSVKRLDKLKKSWEKRGLKKTPKSIWELAKYDNSKDELIIEGLSDEGMRMFRNAVREAKANITGLMTEEDINQANINIYTNLLMQFKNWMPGMYKERFDGIKYYRDYDIVQQGKYSVIGKELISGYTEADPWTKVASMMIVSATKMAADIATFGLSRKLFGGFYKINQDAARIEYTKYIEQHPEAKDMEFEDFVEMKQRQLASGLAEFRALLLIAMLVFAAGGDWDDDGHPDYRDNYALRQLYKVILKAQMELGFSTNPKDVITLLGKGLLPISKVLVDIANTFGNTVDESRDIVFGENSPQDKTPVGYYSTRWIKGVNGLRKTVDWFYEQDKTPAGAK